MHLSPSWSQTFKPLNNFQLTCLWSTKSHNIGLATLCCLAKLPSFGGHNLETFDAEGDERWQHQTKQERHAKPRDCCIQTRLAAWPYYGQLVTLCIWASVVSGLAADSDSVPQADNRLPAMRLRSLWYPYPSLHVLSCFGLQIGKVRAACSAVGCTHTGRWTGLDWTGLGAAAPVAPQGLEGSTPWGTC